MTQLQQVMSPKSTQTRFQPQLLEELLENGDYLSWRDRFFRHLRSNGSYQYLDGSWESKMLKIRANYDNETKLSSSQKDELVSAIGVIQAKLATCTPRDFTRS